LLRKRYSNKAVSNIIHLVKLFFVRPLPGVPVMMQWGKQQLFSTTASDGFFKFEWQSAEFINPGWHSVTVYLLDKEGNISVSGAGSIFIPHATQYAFISDIDDTVLVSYAATTFKRLQTVFTKNPRTRKIFADVAEHYNLLSVAHTTAEFPNPFFYVSASEWNLYDDLVDFFSYNQLPDGVFLLNEIKRWYQLFSSLKTKHQGKLMRVARLMEAFPGQQFILLGDNTQTDPEIYTAIADKYPGNIAAIYIRNMDTRKEQQVKDLLASVRNKSIHTCVFNQTQEVIAYSKSIGLIT